MIVTKKHYDDTDEIYAKQYYCPSCQTSHMRKGDGYIRMSGMLYEWFNYCPICGIELEWDID